MPGETMPYTPIVWGSFITGKPPHEHKSRLLLSTDMGFVNFLRQLPVIRNIKGKRDLLEKLGFPPWLYMHIANKDDLGTETIFDIIEDSVAIWVPSYNPCDNLYWALRKAMKKGIKEYERCIWRVHRVRYLEMIRQLKRVKNWSLFMAYYDLADLLGHIYISKKRYKLYIAYRKLDKLVNEVKRMIPNDTFFLIVSDHGMTYERGSIFGKHSDYAFWSFNMDITQTPREITDFYNIILSLINR